MKNKIIVIIEAIFLLIVFAIVGYIIYLCFTPEFKKCYYGEGKNQHYCFNNLDKYK